MLKKTVFPSAILAVVVLLLSACGSVGSVAPAKTAGHTVKPMCNLPQLPICQ